MSNSPYGNLYLYQEKRKLEAENDKYREQVLTGLYDPLISHNRIQELISKIKFNERQIQEIEDFLRPPIEEVKPKKKGFYLFGYKIF
jgi:hypothetical protein